MSDDVTGPRVLEGLEHDGRLRRTERMSGDDVLEPNGGDDVTH